MKRNIIIGLLSLITMPLSSCGVHTNTYPDADKYVAGNVMMHDVNITSLDIDWISGTLTLIEDDSIGGVEIEEDTDATKEQELVHSYLNNGKLNIKFCASGYTFNRTFGIKKNLKVKYCPGLNDININLTSGKASAETLTAKKIDLDMTSGSISVNTIKAQDVDVDFTSGDIVINHLTASNFNSDSTSGTIKVGFDDISKASFDLTSGNVDMTLPSEGGKVKVDKTSGKVNAIRDCSVNKNTYTFGEGTAEISVSMTSGKITIR